MRSGGPATTLGMAKHTVEKMFETYIKFDSFTYESLRYDDHYKGKTEDDWKKDMKAADPIFPKDIKFSEANAILDRLIVEKGIKMKPSLVDLNKFNELSEKETMVLMYKCDTRNYFFKLDDFIHDKTLVETGRNELIQRQQYIINNWVLGKIGLITTPTVFEEFKKKLADFVLDKQELKMGPTAPTTMRPAQVVLQNQRRTPPLKTRRRYMQR